MADTQTQPKMPFKIVISSYQRPNLICLNPLLPVSHVICHSDEQVELYQATAKQRGAPAPLGWHTHPDLPHLAAIHNYVQDNLWDTENEPFIVHCDDDFVHLEAMMHWRRRIVKDPIDIAAIFWETHLSAKDAGAGLFGYWTGKGFQVRNAYQPILLRRWVGGVYGVIDPSLRHDYDMRDVEEVDISMAALASHRIIWCDMRWTKKFGPGFAPGGNQRNRTTLRMRESVAQFNRKWKTDAMSLQEDKDGVVKGFAMRGL